MNRFKNLNTFSILVLRSEFNLNLVHVPDWTGHWTVRDLCVCIHIMESKYVCLVICSFGWLSNLLQVDSKGIVGSFLKPLLKPRPKPKPKPLEGIPPLNSFYELSTLGGGGLVFFEEFDGNTIDLEKWEIETGCAGYNGLQCYTASPDNIAVADGLLTITATVQPNPALLNLSPCESPPENDALFFSARLRQKGRGFRFGSFHMRAKAPQGYQLWPSFWMLPEKASNCKYEEIDIFEYNAGRDPTSHPLVYGTAFHGSGPDSSLLVQRSGTTEVKNTNVQDFSQQFHEYSVIWTEDYIEWKFDGEPYFGASTQVDYWQNEDIDKIPCPPNMPFDQTLNLILNVAVGGSFFNGLSGINLTTAQAWPDPTFQIDWIRIYQTFI